MSGSRSPDQPSIVDAVRLLTATRRRRALIGVCSLIIAIVALPVVQGVVYGVLVGAPSVLQWVVVGGLGTAIAVRRTDTNPRTVLLLGVGLTLLLALVVGPWVGSIYTREHLADEMSTQAVERETLPNTSTERARVLPREVGDQYADSSVQFPQYRTATSDIAYRGDSYVWSYALVPDNLFVRLFGSQRGAVYVDMERSDKRVAVRETRFQNGRGQLVTDSFAYRATLHRPTVRHRPDTAFVFEHEGEAYLAQSFVRHEWQIRLAPLPQVYAVPRFGGVEVMDQRGSIRTIPAADVAESDLLVGQNVYPYHLARLRVLATNLNQGYLNTITAKEGVLRLAALPSENNARSSSTYARIRSSREGSCRAIGSVTYAGRPSGGLGFSGIFVLPNIWPRTM